MSLAFLSKSRRLTSITLHLKHAQGLFLSKNPRRIKPFGSFKIREKSYQAAQLFASLDPQELTPKERAPIAGAKYLPGSDGEGMPEFLEAPRQGLPHGYKIQNADQLSLTEWAQHCRKLIDEELTKHGAVFFRGLPLYDGEHFSTFVNALGYSSMDYDGVSAYRPSFNKALSTYISSTEDKGYNMEPHNDMSYLSVYPLKIFVYCDVAPPEGTGGLTPLGFNSEVIEKLDPKVVQKFEEKQIRYHRNMRSGIKGFVPWQETFNTDNRGEAEKILEENNCFYKWNDDDSLYYWYNLPAIVYHPVTGEKVWFNQVHSLHASYYKYHSSPAYKEINVESDFHYPAHSTYGDGTDIEPEVLQHIRAIKWQCSVGIQWRNSDMVVLDNLQVTHGRMSYTGERKLIVYMSKD